MHVWKSSACSFFLAITTQFSLLKTINWSRAVQDNWKFTRVKRTYGIDTLHTCDRVCTLCMYACVKVWALKSACVFEKEWACLDVCGRARVSSGLDFTVQACWTVGRIPATRSVFPPHDKFLDFLTTHSWCIIGHGHYMVPHILSLGVWEVSDCLSVYVCKSKRMKEQVKEQHVNQQWFIL